MEDIFPGLDTGDEYTFSKKAPPTELKRRLPI